MRKLKRKIERNKLNKMTIDDFKNGIFEYRKHVTEEAFAYDEDEEFSFEANNTSESSSSAGSVTTSTTDSDDSSQSPTTPNKPSATPLRDVPIENPKVKTPPPPSNKYTHADVLYCNYILF